MKIKQIELRNTDSQDYIEQDQNKVYKDIGDFNKKYNNEGSISNGTFGTVDKIKLKEFDENLSNLKIKFAVKKLNCPNKEMLQKQEKEVLALQQINLLPGQLRKYVIRLYEQYWDPEEAQIYIVIPRAETSFEHQIQKCKRKNTFYKASDLCFKLSCALLGLSSLDILEILHRDIKPLNMLIMENGSLVLADFGTAKQYGSKNTVYTGTPTYCSLEMLQMFSQQIDEDYYNQNNINVIKNNDLYGIGLAFIFAASLIEPPCYPLSSNNYQGFIEMRDEYFKKAFGVIEVKKILSLKFIELLKGIVNVDYNKRYDLQTCLRKMSELPDW